MESQKIKKVQFGCDKHGLYWGQITWNDGEISATTGNTHRDLQVWASLWDVTKKDWNNKKNWEGVK